jgi:hypothetical protein
LILGEAIHYRLKNIPSLFPFPFDEHKIARKEIVNIDRMMGPFLNIQKREL